MTYVPDVRAFADQHDAPASAETRVFQLVHEFRTRFLDALSAGVSELVGHGEWQAAIKLVVVEGRISEADLARGLEVMRSTVNRWMNGQTVPQAASVPQMVSKIQEMLRN